MNAVPPRPLAYHITHIENLASILGAGGLWSDAKMARLGGPRSSIGIADIKQRRMGLPVKCHAGDVVGEYVPFNFCPRSVMLYILYRGNNSELTYRAGQGPIVHLELDVTEAIAWCDEQSRRWAFSLSNAGAVYSEFRCRIDQLDEVNWPAVQATDFRGPEIKEGKQAEFLIRDFVPWPLVRRIGVHSAGIERQVNRDLARTKHRPSVEVSPSWYF